MALIPPAEAMEGMLRGVDTHVNAVNGDHPAEFIKLHMAAAQVQATCALVHAVRELTGEVRKLRETP